MFKRKAKIPAARNPEYVSKQAPVFSYHASRNPSDTESSGRKKEQIKPTKRWVRNLPSLIAITVVFGCLLYATTLSVHPRVLTTLNQKDLSHIRSTDEYTSRFSELLDDSIFNRSKLTIDTKAVGERMRSNNPELSSVSISLPLLGRRPVILIQASQPRLIVSNVRGSYIVSDNGTALMEVSQAKGSVRGLQVINDESGLELKQGKPVLTKTNVEFITTVQYQLSSKNLQVASISLPRTANEVHVRLKDEQYFIKFNLSGKPLQQVGALIAAQEQLRGANKPSEYIDVRVEDRIFVK